MSASGHEDSNDVDDLILQTAWTEGQLDCDSCGSVFATVPDGWTERTIIPWAEITASKAKDRGWVAQVIEPNYYVLCPSCVGNVFPRSHADLTRR